MNMRTKDYSQQSIAEMTTLHLGTVLSFRDGLFKTTSHLIRKTVQKKEIMEGLKLHHLELQLQISMNSSKIQIDPTSAAKDPTNYKLSKLLDGF
jgi:hypothetical protein